MAKNKGGYRKGSVDNRVQSKNSNDKWVKKDATTNKPLAIKKDGKPFKGIAKSIDGRRK